MANDTGLTEQPDSPRISSDGDTTKYTHIFWCAKGEAKNNVPGKHSANTHGGKGYFVDSNISGNAAYDVLELTYQDPLPEVGWESIKEGKCQPIIRTSVIEKPLCQHPDYVMVWDHYLECREKDMSVALPASYNTMKTKDGLVGNKIFRWKHKSEAVGKGCVQRTPVTMPEEEAYYYPAAEVQEKYYYRKKADAVAKIIKTGKRSSPKETFNQSCDWLNLGGELQQEGHYWVCSVSYQGAVKWNTKLYGT